MSITISNTLKGKLNDKLHNSLITVSYGHGNCNCSKPDINTINLRLNKQITVKLWNDKVITTDYLTLGSECINTFKVIAIDNKPVSDHSFNLNVKSFSNIIKLFARLNIVALILMCLWSIAYAFNIITVFYIDIVIGMILINMLTLIILYNKRNRKVLKI